MATCFLGNVLLVILESREMITIGVLAYIPTARHRELLERTLVSLTKQEGAPAFQTLLVDNGNEDSGHLDGTSNWLKFLAERHGASYLRRETREIAAARDLVVRSEARYVGFVDSDVEAPPTWLADLVAELDRDQSVVAVASSNRPPLGESAFEDALWALFQAPWNFLGSAQAFQQSGGFRDVDHLSSCAVLYRREAVLRVGGYDTRFTVVCEDLELSRRLRSEGRLRLLGTAPVIHRQDLSERAWWSRMFRYGWGQIEVMRKHPSAVFSLKGALIPLFFLALLAGLLALRGNLLPLALLIAFYLLVAIGGVLLRNRKLPHSTRLRAIVLTAGTHVSYVLGMLAGVLGLFRNPVGSKSPNQRVGE